MAEEVTRELRCGQCGEGIVCCEFCDGEDSPKAICYGCLIVALGESVSQAHVHGG